MNILGVLKSKFKVVEPIFERDILALGYSLDDINDTLEENVFEKVDVNIQGFDFGNVYTLVEYDNLLDNYFKCSDFNLSAIELFFTGFNNSLGYRFGFSALNLIGLSNQVCCSIDIKSKLVTVDIVINLGNCIINISPLFDNYDSSLVLYYMFAEAIDNFSNYFDCSLQLVKSLILNEFKLDYSTLERYVKNKGVFYEIFK